MRRIVGAAIAIAGTVGFWGLANAADWTLRPKVTAGAEYDDNIRLSANNQESTSAGWVSGALEFGRETEVREAKGRIRLDFINYTNSKISDESNQYFDFTAAQKGELNTLRLDAAARRDTTIVTDRVPTAPEDVDVALTTQEVRRTRATIAPSWRHQLSERTDLGAAYSYLDTTYDKSGFVDYHSHQVDFDIGHDLSERDRVTAELGASEYRAPDASKKYDTLSLVAQYQRHLTQTFVGVLGLGARRTRFDLPGNNSGDDNGIVFRLRGEQKGERTTWEGLMERSVFPSGSGDVVEADQLVLRVGHKLTPLMDVSMRARYLRKYAIVNADPNQDSRYVYLEPKLSWSFSREVSLSASYRYRRKSNDAGSASAESNAVYIALTYAAL